MKKLLMCLVVIFAALALAVPNASALGDTEIDNHNGQLAVGSTGIQNSGNNNLILQNNGNLGTLAGAEVTNTNTNTNTNMNMNMNMNKNENKNVNVNENKNVNVNNNSNSQGQEQGQDQEQVQGQEQGQSQSINQTFEAAEIPRQFAIGTEINYPGLPGYFGPATNQPNYVKAEAITMFQKKFTREYVEAALTSHTGTSLSMKKRFHYYTGKKAASERKAEDALTVTINKPEGKRVRVVGYMNIWTSSVNKDSLDVFFSALEEMLNVQGGANTVWITGEGAMQVTKAFGWGIGLSYTQAFVTDNNKNSGTGTGGTGISGGEAGFRAKPFMQLQLLIVE